MGKESRIKDKTNRKLIPITQSGFMPPKEVLDDITKLETKLRAKVENLENYFSKDPEIKKMMNDFKSKHDLRVLLDVYLKIGLVANPKTYKKDENISYFL
ncbi:MAG: hypothetical protein GF353_28660 [Candidatus Lokiarchaeota archaeon]|nr:hypothetical protein [Candidatus Lokiarchaeota archaeon]MBD3353975.1 hypothetical protein [Candidatus Lokiarchaeota archaeon]